MVRRKCSGSWCSDRYGCCLVRDPQRRYGDARTRARRDSRRTALGVASREGDVQLPLGAAQDDAMKRVSSRPRRRSSASDVSPVASEPQRRLSLIGREASKVRSRPSCFTLGGPHHLMKERQAKMIRELSRGLLRGTTSCNRGCFRRSRTRATAVALLRLQPLRTHRARAQDPR